MIPPDFLSAFILPTIKNHVDQVVTERAPWEGSNTAPSPRLSKTAVNQWHKNPATDHLYYTMYEAEMATMRTSAENPPRNLRALIVDYECHNFTDEAIAGALASRGHDLLPTFISRSHRRGVHAIWCIEEPLWCGQDDYRLKLLAWFRKKLGLDRLFPGMDGKSYEKANLFYSCGTEWQQVSDNIISETVLGKAAFNCGATASFKRGNVLVPFEVIEKAIEERFPGRWRGPVEDGARGIRFWDMEADAESAIMRPEGVTTFTGDKRFYSWATIFGSKFVKEFEENRIGEAAQCAWYDGRKFWVYSDKLRMWTQTNTEDLARKLKVEHRLEATVDKGVTSSKVDQCIHVISTTRIVHSAAPFIQRPQGPIMIENKQHLNIAAVVVFPAAEGGCYTPEQDFPWINNFLATCFVHDGEKQHKHEAEQLIRFLAWLRRAYIAGRDFQPCQGHVLVLAGTSGCGKTLLANALVGLALGGQKDASRFLLGETHFNKGLYEAPLWVVNDAVAASDPGRKARYNSLVKRVAANREFEREVKFGDASDVLWMGRLIITCNTDPESLGMMPQVDASMEDKILALHAWGGDEGQSKEDVEREKGFGMVDGLAPDQHIKKEMGAFLSWLLDWEVPAWVERDARFGYRSYYEPSLKALTDSSGYTADFNEILAIYLRNFFTDPANKDMDILKLPATTLHRKMLDPEISPVCDSVKTYTSQLIGKRLSTLVSRGEIDKRPLDGIAHYFFVREKWAAKTQN